VEKYPFGQYKNKFGETEIRTSKEYPEAFSLYPGEKMVGKIEPMFVVPKGHALKLKAIRDFSETIENKEVAFKAGELYLKKGPIIYVPRVCEEIVFQIKPTVF